MAKVNLILYYQPMAAKKLHHITIIGSIASGKSTAANIITKSLKAHLVDADLFEENPFLELYVKDMPRWAFASELYFTRLRLQKVKEVLDKSKNQSVVVDAGLLMSTYVYCKNHLIQGTMTAAEWQFYLTLINDLKTKIKNPDLVVYLKTSPTTQLKRIKNRGRDFETAYKFKYLAQLTDRLEELIESFQASHQPYLIFNSEKHNFTKPSGKRALISQVKTALKQL